MSNLDMSLDDIIKMNKTSQSRPAASGPGPTRSRRFINRFSNRVAPYSFNKGATETQREDSVFSEERAAAAFYPIQGGTRFSAIDSGTKLLISNLDYGVTDYDINELFSHVGELKMCSVHYDISGRSEGTAEVVFSRYGDAEAAIQRYNHVQLDGKPMKIEIVGLTMAPSPALHPASHRDEGRGRAVGRLQGSGRGNDNISAQDLDADLDKYHADAKLV